MGADDDLDCMEHVWRLVGVTFGDDGATQDYVCERCSAVSVRQPSTDVYAAVREK